MKEPVVMSWSGGKDSAMALHELFKADEYEVTGLLTTVSEEFRRISHHGVRESLLDAQAEAIGLPLDKVCLSHREIAAGARTKFTARSWKLRWRASAPEV